MAKRKTNRGSTVRKRVFIGRPGQPGKMLLIDTADIELIKIGLAEGGQVVAQRVLRAKYRQAELLLPAIDRLLRLRRVKPASIRSVAVAASPGPFTALRIGIATANTFAYAVGIPVIGITAASSLAQLAERAAAAQGTGWVTPSYGAEPSITIKVTNNR